MASNDLGAALRTFEPAREPYRRKKPNIRPVKTPLTSAGKRGRGRVTLYVLGVFYAAALFIILICGNIALAEASATLTEKTSELEIIDSETKRLNLQLSSMTSLNNVETQATTRLGLSEPKQSQTQYIVVERDNEVTHPEEDDAWWDKLQSLINDIVSRITG